VQGKDECSALDLLDGHENMKEVLKVVLDEIMELSDIEQTVGVVCGVQGKDECSALDLLDGHENVKEVIPFWTCPELDSIQNITATITVMQDCERRLLKNLRESTDSQGNGIDLDVFILDSSAPHSMLQIFDAIWTSQRHREKYLSDEAVLVALSNDSVDGIRQRNFLDRFHLYDPYGPTSKAVFKFQVNDNQFELGIVSCGDDEVLETMLELEAALFQGMIDEGVTDDIELRTITGGASDFQYGMAAARVGHSLGPILSNLID
jgi:hypothetical protein